MPQYSDASPLFEAVHSARDLTECIVLQAQKGIEGGSGHDAARKRIRVPSKHLQEDYYSGKKMKIVRSDRRIYLIFRSVGSHVGLHNLSLCCTDRWTPLDKSGISGAYPSIASILTVGDLYVHKGPASISGTGNHRCLSSTV